MTLALTETWRPTILDASRQAPQLDELRRAATFVHDTIDAQLRDLAATRSPHAKLSSGDVAARVQALLGGRPADECGRWVYYPWSRRLVHILGPAEFRELRLDRNRHKITAAEQARLGAATVGIVGLSVGNAIALTLALEGVGGHLRLADLDRLELSNMNRVRAGVHEIGLPKVVLAARQIAEIDPYLEISILADGVTPENVERFLLGDDELGPAVDVVVDECDSVAVKVLLRERARELCLPVVMETSDRGVLDVERFDLEPDRPLLHGRMDGLTHDDVAARLEGPPDAAAEYRTAIVLQLLDADLLSTRMAASMVEMDTTLSSWPQLASDVVLGGASATVAIRTLVLGQPLHSGRRFIDLQDAATAAADGARPGPAPAHAPTTHPPRGQAHPDRADDVPAEIARIVEHAVLAPSGGNVQPWHFHWDGERLWVSLDAVRARSVLDGRGSAALLALGAAVENAVIAAAAEGYAATVEPFALGEASDVVAAISFACSDAASLQPLAALAALVRERATERRLGPRQTVARADLDAIAAAAREHGADIQLRTEPAALAEVGRIVGVADRIRVLCAETNAEVAGELRWTAQEAVRTRDGIMVSSVVRSASARAAIRLVMRPDVAAFLRETGAGSRLEVQARTSFAAASAAGLLTLATATRPARLAGGRAMQRAWLAATARGLAFQPTSVLLGQLELLDDPRSPDYTAAETATLRSLDERLYRVFDRPRGDAALLFRIARVDGSPERSLRMPATWTLSAGRPSG